jgi:hypothetical protein
MQVYLLAHVTYPTQIDGDPVEYIAPLEVYATEEEAVQAASNKLREAAVGPDDDEYQVIPLPFVTLLPPHESGLSSPDIQEIGRLIQEAKRD